MWVSWDYNLLWWIWIFRKRRETVEDCVEEIEKETLKETGRSIIAHLTQLGIDKV